MRCLNFLEEKLYLWSSEKICFGKSFPEYCPYFSSRRSFRGKLAKPQGFPSPVTGEVLEEAGEMGCSLWEQSVTGDWMGACVLCTVCWSHYHSRPECTDWVCSRNHIPLGQCCSQSAREVFKAGLQVPGCASNIVKCCKRSPDEFGWRSK